MRIRIGEAQRGKVGLQVQKEASDQKETSAAEAVSRVLLGRHGRVPSTPGVLPWQVWEDVGRGNATPCHGSGPARSHDHGIGSRLAYKLL